jgi:hypothetical protein
MATVGVCHRGAGIPEVCLALLALREGPLLEQAVRALPTTPEVLLVNATGRDYPRRAGLALHLGAVLGLPTVRVTVRPLVAEGSRPADRRGAMAPLRLGGEVVGCWVARWWAAGCGPGRAPSRWPSTPPGGPTPRPWSRSCWPRPVVPAPRAFAPRPHPRPNPAGAQLMNAPTHVGVRLGASQRDGQAFCTSAVSRQQPHSSGPYCS